MNSLRVWTNLNWTASSPYAVQHDSFFFNQIIVYVVLNITVGHLFIENTKNMFLLNYICWLRLLSLLNLIIKAVYYVTSSGRSVLL